MQLLSQTKPIQDDTSTVKPEKFGELKPLKSIASFCLSFITSYYEYYAFMALTLALFMLQ